MFMNNTPPEVSKLDSRCYESLDALVVDEFLDDGIRIRLDVAFDPIEQFRDPINDDVHRTVVSPGAPEQTGWIAPEIVPWDEACCTSQFLQWTATRVWSSANGGNLNVALAVRVRQALFAMTSSRNISTSSRAVCIEWRVA